ncbi:ATP-binding protein [Clostridium ganghwense]|uniref:ATP-binding protein n=1 Tax=Clostridium ganghwense TaxID=312089 RepID=A0ABT4CUZ2_9CLOT|nr:ATP-binding protein [Clostridium ganghwense]MCY6371774.1 ATP-binding protein [Clostridium ganghwense]
MNIAILSGKGGTGKTTVSTNLARVLKANYIDCDVEEPNGFIFLKPEIVKKEDVKVIYPVIDDDKCIMCGKCAEICQFNALAKTKKDILLFQKLCHGCGACQIVCPNNAINYEERTTGIVEEGKSEDITCMRGLLDIGEPMAVPVIKKLLKSVKEGVNIVDCSPGTSCNVVNILQQVDAAVLVTETTEFGLHDLKLAVELVRNFNIPFGIIINKEMNRENIIRNYCNEENIKIVGAIPYNREIAEIYSKGKMLLDEQKYKDVFEDIAGEIKAVIPWS